MRTIQEELEKYRMYKEKTVFYKTEMSRELTELYVAENEESILKTYLSDVEIKNGKFLIGAKE